MKSLGAVLALARPLALAACSSPAATGTTGSTSSGATGGGAGGHGSTAHGGSGGQDAGDNCGTTGVDKGPWTNAAASTGIRVRWDACRAGVDPTLVFAPEAGGADQTATATVTPYAVTKTYYAPLAPSEPPDVAGTYYLHEVALTGLSPSTCYVMHLQAEPARTGRFCTARNPGDAFKFFSIGDTNPGLADATVNILAHTMPLNPDFTVHGGDIQYYSSGLETWQYWFQRMNPLLTQGAFYPAVGNHEEESQNPAEYDEYVDRLFGNAGFDGSTTHYRFSSGGVWFFAMSTEEAIDLASPQGIWLSAELADAASQPGYRFSVVYFHRPLVTCGDTGDDPTTRAQLEPLFAQYKVPLVIQAHMHGYERFEFPGITYITSAGGGGLLGDVDGNLSRPYCGSRVASGNFHFGIVFDVTTGQLSGTVIDDAGATRDTFSEAVP